MAYLRRSLVINFFSSSGAALLQFIVSLVLARLLRPDEIGVFSMTVVFINIAHIFRDFGIAAYVQREPDLTHDKMRSAMGMMFVSSWSMGALLYLASGWAGRWFDAPAMTPVMQVLALGFVLIPFGSITQSLLIRELRADRQALIVACGTLSYCVSCIVLALLGFGTMSLAWANLVNILACVLACIPLRPPGMPWLPSLRHWRDVARFGIGSLAANCAQAVNNAVPDLLLGKLGSPRLVGLLSRANSTVSIFHYVAGSTVTYGAISYLAQAHHRGESLAPTLGRATALLTGIGWPAFALTTLFGADLVLALYGHAWLDCVSAILPLSLAAALAILFEFNPAALAATGRPHLGALPVLVTLMARVGAGLLLYDGTLVSFAWAICCATFAAAPIMLLQQRRYFGYRLGPFLRSLGPSTVVTAACLCGGLLLAHLVPAALAPAARLALLAAPLALLWYWALRWTGHPLLDEVHRLGNAARARLPRRA
jgi:O-antigen/teichoic acid export membrane protein